MALVSVGYIGSVVLVDQGGNKATLRYDLNGIDHATALLNMQAIITDLDAVTTALVLSYSVAEAYQEDTSLFGVGEIENQALFTAKLAGTPLKFVNLKVPAPVDGIFIGATGPEYNEVDTSNALAQAYLANFEAGAEANVSDGENVRDSATAGNWTGKRIHRGSRKG